MSGFISSVIGSLWGLLIGAVIGVMLAVAVGVNTILGITVSPIAASLIGGMGVTQIMVLAGFASFVAYLYAYATATAALSTPPLSASGTGPIPDDVNELAARGFTIGLTAMLNFVLLSLLMPICVTNGSPSFFCTIILVALVTGPIWFWPFLPLAVGLIHWLCIFPALSRNPYFQVLVGWVSWVAPMSYLATFAGLILFLLNLPFSLVLLGLNAFRIDFRTGTIESTTAGLVPGLASALFNYPSSGMTVGGFSIGKFNFLIPALTGPGSGLGAQSAFVGPTISAHEVGHGLNTSAMGGVVLWINAVDENLPPFARGRLAYGELLAESHANRSGRLRVRIWS